VCSVFIVFESLCHTEHSLPSYACPTLIIRLSIVDFHPPFTVSWVIEWIPKQGIGRNVLVQLAV